MASQTMAGAIASTLAEALANDASVVVLGESVRSGRTTEGLRERFGAERVIEVPVADHGALGLAMGMALAGKRPIVELSGTSRLLAVAEVLAEAAALASSEFGCPILVRVPMGHEAGPRVDRAVADALAGIEGLTVAVPSSPAQAAGLIRAACRARGPVVLLEPRSLYAQRGSAGEGHWPLGAAKVLREGSHVTLAAWGAGVEAALAAAETLAAEGIEADVIDVVSLSPADAALIGGRVRATGRLVVVSGGDAVGDRLVRVALVEAFEFLEAPPSVAGADVASVAQAARGAVHF